MSRVSRSVVDDRRKWTWLPLHVSHGRVALAVAMLVVCCQVEAIDLVVEPRQVSVDESVRVILTLEGDAAKVDSVDLPLENLESSGPPTTSSQFTIVNGVMSRKKTFTWWVSPVDSGGAKVGPIQIETPDGGLVLVPAVSVRVLPSAEAGASSPSEALDRLYLSGRDEVVLVADAQPVSAVVGQELVVTWTLYSAVPLRGFTITSIPKLDAFWVEEDPVAERSPDSARVDGHEVQRMYVRRASLFPLRDGELEIPPLEVRIEVVRPFRDPFGGVEWSGGRVAEVRRRSGPVTVSVKPLEVAADAVGQFRLECSKPVISPEGLVTFDATMEGTGSLRSMPSPKFTGEIDGKVEVQNVSTDVTGRSPLRMRRVWRYVVFPRASGRLNLPAMEARTYVPGAASERVLRTPPTSVNVELSRNASLPGGEEADAGDEMRGRLPMLVGLVLVSAFIVTIVFLRRRTRVSGELRRIVAAAGHTITLRKRLDEAVSKRGLDPVLLYSESSERGDAWRAAMSLVDRIEKEPEAIDDREREVRSRVRRLLDDLESAPDRS